jgi:hypothetical protein
MKSKREMQKMKSSIVRTHEWRQLARAPWLPVLGAIILAIHFLVSTGAGPAAPNQESGATASALFETSAVCQSCHNGLVTASGRDVSIGVDWRSSMMANAARDPYWQAAVRRETIDHPPATEAIERECSTCHMPMAHYQTLAAGAEPEIFAFLPITAPHLAAGQNALLAADGVGCVTCHQITPENLGERGSFVGKFSIDMESPAGLRKVYGPFDVDRGRQRIMHSASGFIPAKGSHIQEAALCASCHTLITHALDENHEVVGELPEQVPYLEWLHSDYAESRSCQDCHMPVVDEEVSVSSVWGQPRANVNRHAFRGGNFLIPRIFSRYRADLGVTAPTADLQASVSRTLEHLQSSSAKVRIDRVMISETGMRVEIEVTNYAGHKLPTAYPSRRTWLHFKVVDRFGTVVFESGALQPNGSIDGNDNDLTEGSYEPHHDSITRPDEVQVYEAIMVDPQGSVTTGLTSGMRFVKDNRILPKGFDKSTADEEVAVHGLALDDPDFGAASDRVGYVVGLDPMSGPFDISVELWYQPVGYRWAQNLRDYDAMETRRFADYFDGMAQASAVVLARASGSSG